MAKTTITKITDDIDGSQDAQEVRLSYEGVDYVIDLGKKNKSSLEKALKPYLDAGTRVTKRAGRRASAKPNTKRDLAPVRVWARDRGIKVSDRGRVPASVIEQYDAAH